MRVLQFHNEEDLKILTKKLPKCKTDEDYIKAVECRDIMFDICKKHNGLGLSSNQIGVELKFFVIYTNKVKTLYINPILLNPKGEKKRSREGCLSWDNGKKTDIKRFLEIEVEYENEYGDKVNETLRGVTAIIYQHELDHMKGRVI